jgi:hypothetical protein
MKLPEEVKVKWLAALRSGEFKQGRCAMYSQLHDNYCCLGVAAVVCGIYKKDLDLGFVSEDGQLPGFPKELTTEYNYDIVKQLMRMNEK